MSHPEGFHLLEYGRRLSHREEAYSVLETYSFPEHHFGLLSYMTSESDHQCICSSFSYDFPDLLTSTLEPQSRQA